MQQINKCSHIAFCIREKKCYYGKPELGGFKCSFFDQTIHLFKEEKLDKKEVKVRKFEKEKEKKVARIEDKINKLKRRISLIHMKYEKKIDKLNGVKK